MSSPRTRTKEGIHYRLGPISRSEGVGVPAPHLPRWDGGVGLPQDTLPPASVPLFYLAFQTHGLTWVRAPVALLRLASSPVSTALLSTHDATGLRVVASRVGSFVWLVEPLFVAGLGRWVRSSGCRLDGYAFPFAGPTRRRLRAVLRCAHLRGRLDAWAGPTVTRSSRACPGSPAHPARFPFQQAHGPSEPHSCWVLGQVP